MIVISDTSPISGLIIIGHLDLLRKVYGNVLIPSIVLQELLALEKFGYHLNELKKSSWIKIAEPQNTGLVEELLMELDRGEASAIALALELEPSLLVIDEKKGRKIAEEMGVEVIGLIGVLIEAKEKGIISRVQPILDLLREKARFRISESFYQRILERLREKE